MEKVRRGPDKIGSYKEEDVIFLLRDISHVELERKTDERESLIQSGVHYSEMLPVEHEPSKEYIQLFHYTLKKYSKRVAAAVGTVGEQIKEKRGLENLVLVSLARAGTPIGILLKRYLELKYGEKVPHYSVSIIRGRGIDQAAIDYIFERHPSASIQFVDGWTGKGAITMELIEACEKYNKTRRHKIDSTLAVLADPGHCSSLFGTREDFFIPSACLNSTVSGLVSRTVLNEKLIEKGDFHGAKFYRELESADVSALYVDTITNEFTSIEHDVQRQLSRLSDTEITWKGLKSVERIQKKYDISSLHFIKPGIGETTRVLLRRVPWKILIHPGYADDLTHILLLAKEKQIHVEEYRGMTYSCCGIIKEK